MEEGAIESFVRGIAQTVTEAQDELRDFWLFNSGCSFSFQDMMSFNPDISRHMDYLDNVDKVFPFAEVRVFNYKGDPLPSIVPHKAYPVMVDAQRNIEQNEAMVSKLSAYTPFMIKELLYNRMASPAFDHLDDSLSSMVAMMMYLSETKVLRPQQLEK